MPNLKEIWDELCLSWDILTGELHDIEFEEE